MLGGRHARVGARPAATQAASEVVAEAAAKPGWRDQIAHALDSARGPAAATSTAGDVAEAVVKPGLLDRIRASAPDLAALRGPSGGAAATVAGEVAETAVKGLGASARSGLFAQLREAAELAAKIK
jgi:hypothetical protein